MRPPAFLVLLSACSHPGVVPARAPIEMAITFDDLPRAGPDIPGMSRLRIHREILAVLRKHAVPQAYGFINGKGAEDADGRAALEAWVAAGYPLGNHTYSHRTPEELPVYLADLHRNEPLLRELLPGPEDRWKVFRYPNLRQGDTREVHDAIRAHLAEHGYRIAEVTVDFGDWAWNEPYARCLAQGDQASLEELRRSFLQSAQTFLAFDDSFARRLFGRRIRHLLLLHGGAFDAVMLDDLLSLYESAGVRWISFDDAQRDPVYGHDAQVAPTGGDILQEQVAMERQTPMIPWVTMPLKQLAALCP
ncbi:MAG TPA: polysaccharide deacetylase family protein [Myxococcales bacterium]